MRSPWTTTLAWVGLLVPPAMAEAAEDPTRRARVELTWEAPAECPDAAAVRMQIEQALDARPGSLDITAHATVEHQEGAWVLTVRTQGAAGVGERSVSASACQDLGAAAALIVSIAAAPRPDAAPEGTFTSDGQADTAGDTESEATVIPPAPEPGVEASAEEQADAGTEDREPGLASVATSMATSGTEPAPASQSRTRGWGGQLGLLAGVDGLALPGDVGADGAVVLGLRTRRFLLGLGGIVRLPRRTRVEAVGGNFRWGSGVLMACPVFGLPANAELALCATGEFGRLLGEGRGGTPNRTQRHFWLALAVGPGIWWWPRGRNVGLATHLDVVIPFVQREFVVGDRPVGRTRAAGVRGMLGLVVRFGSSFSGPAGKKGEVRE